ncbi:Putative alpha/beta hydrolase-3 [Colletotrichum destructivum]|uniref:Alpha/beta hydrolase-3 n=1 Tax=Colletotrichum destructivum TaxID=34406 RepID=A0AAX4J4E8_9PEZI|nr:Putative alpha/beta hydrolase-3 [Colletotrichum destructivum]
MAIAYNTTHYSGFQVLSTTYKTISSFSVTSDVLIPNYLTEPTANCPKQAPIMLRYHGGGFITGASLTESFFNPWYMELANRQQAIIVSPNYRLAPEASMDDIMQDIEDHWNWIHTDLPAFIHQETAGGVNVDTGKVLVVGESAGGYLSVMTGLSHAEDIRAVVASYPVIDVTDPYYVETATRPYMGVGPLPRSLLDEHIDRVHRGEIPAVVSEDYALERAPLMFAAMQNGFFTELFPANRHELFPLQRLREGAQFPRGGLFVMHGTDDTLVPSRGSVLMEQMLVEVDPELNFRLTMRPGEHGFDSTVKLDEQWLAEGLAPLVTAWLS